MPFRPGHSGNPKGRPAGATNKASTQLRGMIDAMLKENFDEIKTEFSKLKGRGKLKAFAALAKFTVPALQAIEVQSVFERLPDDQLKELYNQVMEGENGRGEK